MSVQKQDSGSIAWLVAKCGLKILLALSLMLLIYSYPEEFFGLFAVVVAGVSGFFGTIFGLIERGFDFVSTTPWFVIVGLSSLYAWGLCVTTKLKSIKQRCDGFHYLEITLHKLVVVIWLISFCKITQVDSFGAVLTFIVGGLICLIHWAASIESTKVLKRRKKLRNLKAARLGKR